MFKVSESPPTKYPHTSVVSYGQISVRGDLCPAVGKKGLIIEAIYQLESVAENIEKHKNLTIIH